jgi:hypothetical protein
MEGSKTDNVAVCIWLVLARLVGFINQLAELPGVARVKHTPNTAD